MQAAANTSVVQAYIPRNTRVVSLTDYTNTSISSSPNTLVIHPTQKCAIEFSIEHSN